MLGYLCFFFFFFVRTKSGFQHNYHLNVRNKTFCSHLTLMSCVEHDPLNLLNKIQIAVTEILKTISLFFVQNHQTGSQMFYFWIKCLCVSTVYTLPVMHNVCWVLQILSWAQFPRITSTSQPHLWFGLYVKDAVCHTKTVEQILMPPSPTQELDWITVNWFIRGAGNFI